MWCLDLNFYLEAISPPFCTHEIIAKTLMAGFNLVASVKYLEKS